MSSGRVYKNEACTTLVAAITNPKYDGLAIILAGYHADMLKMLDTNEGLKSRVQHFIEFLDWKAADCVCFFSKKAQNGNFKLDIPSIEGTFKKGFEKLVPLKSWGNARDVQKVWEMTNQVRADRVVQAGAADDGEKRLDKADVQSAINALLAARLGGGGMTRNMADDSDLFEVLDQLYRMEQIKEKLKQLQLAYRIAAQDVMILRQLIISFSPAHQVLERPRLLALLQTFCFVLS